MWGLSAATRQTRAWGARAAQIPDPALRRDALDALTHKRGNTYGAALFWILTRERNPSLLRLLVTYQVMWDFLDNASEHGNTEDHTNGLQLHLALVDALDAGRPISDYYRHHVSHHDGGYLTSLVCRCRQCCSDLPGYEGARSLLIREAQRASIQALNHDPHPASRDAALHEWAVREFPDGHEATWFELTGAAGAGLAIYALFALAAEHECTPDAIAATHGAYFPWASAVATMLDSYVDQGEDAANGDHVYVSHYATPQIARRRIGQLVQHSVEAAGSLPGSERHILIVACMVAMYLSKDSARTPEMHPRTAHFARAGGSLTQLLLPILRLWRIAYAQRST